MLTMACVHSGGLGAAEIDTLAAAVGVVVREAEGPAAPADSEAVGELVGVWEATTAHDSLKLIVPWFIHISSAPT